MSNGSCTASISSCEVTYDYDVGDKIRLNMQFRDQATQLLVDPDTVSITITDPSLTANTFNYGDPDGLVVRSDVGVYHYDLLFDASGVWHYRWLSTGNGAGAFESSLGVKAPGPETCPSRSEQLQAGVELLATGPKRVRGDQGEMEERSADDVQKLINLERNLKQTPQQIFKRSVSKLAKHADCR